MEGINANLLQSLPKLGHVNETVVQQDGTETETGCTQHSVYTMNTRERK